MCLGVVAVIVLCCVDGVCCGVVVLCGVVIVLIEFAFKFCIVVLYYVGSYIVLV